MKPLAYSDDARKELVDALKMLGATDNAVHVYMTSFATGRATIGKIAALCKMDRSSAYLACDQLESLGLLTHDGAASRKQVWAKPPKAVLARLRTEMRRLRRSCDAIEESLPKLSASYVEHPTKPVLQFFSGKEGLQQITDDVLEHAQGEILLFTNQSTEKNVFNDLDHKAFIAERLRRGIPIRVLATDGPGARDLKKHDKQAKRETRIVPGQPFTTETYIYADTIAMLSFHEEIVGFTVRSKEFVQAQRWIFEELWKNHL